MKDWLRRLSFRTEFAIVILGAFGLSLLATILALATPDRYLHGAPPINNTSLWHLLIFQMIVGSLLWQLLMLRGWTGDRVGLSSVRRLKWQFLTTPLLGLGLAALAYAAYVVLVLVAANIWPDAVKHSLSQRLVAPSIPLITILLASIVNPVFEEVFVCGYVVSSLRSRLGVANAVNVSAGIRVAYHLYQGIAGVLSVTPFALITATWFARKGRLAPLVFAHALMDFLGIMAASR